MPLEAIVFDFDGVLANTEPLHLNAYQHVLAPIGITLTVEEYYDRYLGLDDQAAFRALAREKPLALNDELLGTLIERKTRYYQALVKDKPVLFPGATECVRRCAGEAPLAIASGALRDEIEIVLRANDLTRFFRAIVAAG